MKTDGTRDRSIFLYEIIKSRINNILLQRHINFFYFDRFHKNNIKYLFKIHTYKRYFLM